MEGYLRLILFFAGAIYILFVIYEMFSNKRSKRSTSVYREPEFRNENLKVKADVTSNVEPVIKEIPDYQDNDDYYIATESKKINHGITRETITPASNSNRITDTHVDDADFELVEPKKTFTSRRNAPVMILGISVFAPAGQEFSSYDLLQAISATGMQFGDMNIFHYYSSTPWGKEKLFSLASATEPGEFDLDNIGEYACAGLTLFLDLRDQRDPHNAFDLMVKTAERLADDLGGELQTINRKAWSDNSYQQYWQNIDDYLSTNESTI